MLPLIMMTLVMAAMYLDAVGQHMAAEREAAERAAWCAENPNRPYPGDGECPDEPWEPRGYDCEPVTDERIVCVRDDTAKGPG